MNKLIAGMFSIITLVFVLVFFDKVISTLGENFVGDLTRNGIQAIRGG